MFVRDLQNDKYILWIDDPDLYERFIALCDEYDFRWIFGTPFSAMPLKHHNHGELLLYTFNHGEGEIGDTNNMFTWGFYGNDDPSKYIKLSDMLDFQEELPNVDMSGSVDTLIAAFT